MHIMVVLRAILYRLRKQLATFFEIRSLENELDFC